MTLTLDDWMDCLTFFGAIECDCGNYFFYCRIHATDITCPDCGLDYS